MTRANFIIVTRDGKFKLQCNSSAYPSNVMEDIINFAVSTASKNSAVIGEGKIGFYDNPDSWELAKFIESVGLTLGWVGNPSYFYTVDFINQTVSAWGTKGRWVNAPKDWEAKGWKGCYESKGRFGYFDANVKGKKIFEKGFKELLFDLNDKDEKILKAGVLAEAMGCSA